MLAEREKCGADKACRQDVQERYADLDEGRNRELASLCKTDNAACGKLNAQLQADAPKIQATLDQLKRSGDLGAAVVVWNVQQSNQAAQSTINSEYAARRDGEDSRFWADGAELLAGGTGGTRAGRAIAGDTGNTGKVQTSGDDSKAAAEALDKKFGEALERDAAGGAKATGNVSNGAENIATYPKLKDQLAQQNLANIAAQDSRLAVAVKGSGTANPNFSVGRGTAAEADQLGKIWVGDGAKKTADGTGWISADGARVYRTPTVKSSPYATTGVQANFETYSINPVTGQKIKVSNGHLNVTD